MLTFAGVVESVLFSSSEINAIDRIVSYYTILDIILQTFYTNRYNDSSSFLLNNIFLLNSYLWRANMFSPNAIMCMDRFAVGRNILVAVKT